LIEVGGRSTVTAQATGRAPAGEAGFRLFAEHLPITEAYGRAALRFIGTTHVQSLAAIGFKLEQARLRLGASAAPGVDELLWQVTKDLSTEGLRL
jgi:hypothetical protein